MKIEEKYLKYAKIKLKISSLEDELSELSDDIKSNILDNGDEIVDMSLGSFYLTRRKKWKYTNAVSVLESEVKTLKKFEEEKGHAKEVEETVSLAFRVKKV